MESEYTPGHVWALLFRVPNPRINFFFFGLRNELKEYSVFALGPRNQSKIENVTQNFASFPI